MSAGRGHVLGCWEDGVLGHRGLLTPHPPSADTAANIPSWLFIFRIPWQGCDCKQLIFSQGHLHPMALLCSHCGVVGCLEPLGTQLTSASKLAPTRGLWLIPTDTCAQPCVVPRSLLVAEEMRSLIVEKGPGPVEDDPDALVKGDRSCGLRDWSFCLWNSWSRAGTGRIVPRLWLGPLTEKWETLLG